MAHSRLIDVTLRAVAVIERAGLLSLGVALAACGGPSVAAPPSRASAAPAEFPMDVRMPRFHSTRFSVSLPLPDGRDWRIDDHKGPLLHAVHEPTRSLVELIVWREDRLVNHSTCEARARELGYVQDLEADTIESPIESVPEGWDTRLWVGVETSKRDPAHATGHLMAFGAWLRKCLYFHFATTARKDDPDAISTRLAFARVRMLREMRLDSLDDVPRERPALAPK